MEILDFSIWTTPYRKLAVTDQQKLKDAKMDFQATYYRKEPGRSHFHDAILSEREFQRIMREAERSGMMVRIMEEKAVPRFEEKAWQDANGVVVGEPARVWP
jgi:hypothetical protein